MGWAYSRSSFLQIQRHIYYPKVYFLTWIPSNAVGLGLHLLSQEPVCKKVITGLLKESVREHDQPGLNIC